MTADYYQELSEFAEELADVAGRSALKYFRSELDVEDKKDDSPVTIADREIEELLRAEILKRYPGHGIIGEEYGSENPSAEFVWVIDPIDGTKAFATGKPLFGTIIGLTHNGIPEVGVVDQAFTRERWVGIANRQTLYNGNQVKVAAPRSIENARAYTASPEPEYLEELQNFDELRQCVKWTLYGCDCYAYGLLAMGCIDIVFERFMATHDIIGLVPIIQGAGGFAADWSGMPLHLGSGDTIMTASCESLGMSALDILAECS